MGTAVNDNGILTRVAGEALTQYARVKLNTSNQVVEADADDKGIGTVCEDVASGGHAAVKLWSAPGTHKMIANGAFSVNDIVYSHDEGEVDDDPDVGVAVGRACEAATAANDIIEVIPMLHEHTGLIYAARADSATVSDTTTETAFDKSKTIDGGELQAGDVIHVIAQGNVPTTNSTDTLNVKLKLGTEIICATGALNVTDADIWYIDAYITIRTLGASGTISATGTTSIGVIGTATAKPFRTASVTEDISGDVAITVTATWSVAHSDNDTDLEALIIQKLRL